MTLAPAVGAHGGSGLTSWCDRSGLTSWCDLAPPVGVVTFWEILTDEGQHLVSAGGKESVCPFPLLNATSRTRDADECACVNLTDMSKRRKENCSHEDLSFISETGHGRIICTH